MADLWCIYVKQNTISEFDYGCYWLFRGIWRTSIHRAFQTGPNIFGRASPRRNEAIKSNTSNIERWHSSWISISYPICSMYGIFTYMTGWFSWQMLVNMPHMEHLGMEWLENGWFMFFYFLQSMSYLFPTLILGCNGWLYNCNAYMIGNISNNFDQCGDDEKMNVWFEAPLFHGPYFR